MASEISFILSLPTNKIRKAFFWTPDCFRVNSDVEHANIHFQKTTLHRLRAELLTADAERWRASELAKCDLGEIDQSD